MSKARLPSPEVLRQLLRYDPETGLFWWRERGPVWFKGSHYGSAEAVCASWNKQRAGKEALTATEGWGYKHGSVMNVPVKAHIAAFMIVHGRLPAGHIDHINMDRADNRIANLREAGHGENLCNRGAPRNNTSGAKGVSWIAAKGKFRSEIQAAGKRQHLGYFLSIEEASDAYRRAADQMHGEFART